MIVRVLVLVLTVSVTMTMVVVHFGLVAVARGAFIVSREEAGAEAEHDHGDHRGPERVTPIHRAFHVSSPEACWNPDKP